MSFSRQHKQLTVPLMSRWHSLARGSEKTKQLVWIVAEQAAAFVDGASGAMIPHVVPQYHCRHRLGSLRSPSRSISAGIVSQGDEAHFQFLGRWIHSDSVFPRRFKHKVRRR